MISQKNRAKISKKLFLTTCCYGSAWPRAVGEKLDLLRLSMAAGVFFDEKISFVRVHVAAGAFFY